MASNPYTDPNRIARQQHQQALQTAQQMSKHSQKIAEDMRRNAAATAATQQRIAQESSERSRKSFEQQLAQQAALQPKRSRAGADLSSLSGGTAAQSVETDLSARPTGKKGRGQFIGWLLVLGLIAYVAWRMLLR